MKSHSYVPEALHGEGCFRSRLSRTRLEMRGTRLFYYALKVALIIFCAYVLNDILRYWKHFGSEHTLVDQKSRVYIIHREDIGHHKCPDVTESSAQATKPPFNASDYAIASYNKTSPQNCTAKVCGVFSRYAPVTVRTTPPEKKCRSICECVTVTLKTKHRLSNVARFVQSLHKYYPGTRVIVADEYYLSIWWALFPTDWAELYRTTPKDMVTYIKYRPGVGAGRKLAAMVADTKYILVVDDDFIVTSQTDLWQLVRALEQTDLLLAAGSVADNYPFDGAVKTVPKKDGAHLVFFPGVFYEHLWPTADCFVGDVTKNFFLADRELLLAGESWDVSRLYYEHEDFFFTMRLRGLKVALCPSVNVKHNTKDRGLAKERMKQYKKWKTHLQTKWEFSDIYYCHDQKYFSKSEDCPIDSATKFG